MRAETRKRKAAEKEAETLQLRLRGAHADLQHALDIGAEEHSIAAIERDIERLTEEWEEWEDEAGYWSYIEQYGEGIKGRA